MTNEKLVDIVAGLPLVQIVWKFAALLSILAFMLLFEAAHMNALSLVSKYFVLNTAGLVYF